MGTPESEVFPEEAPSPPAPPTPLDKPGREAPRPLPRPGLAGGGVEARASELKKPEL